MACLFAVFAGALRNVYAFPPRSFALGGLSCFLCFSCRRRGNFFAVEQFCALLYSRSSKREPAQRDFSCFVPVFHVVPQKGTESLVLAGNVIFLFDRIMRIMYLRLDLIAFRGEKAFLEAITKLILRGYTNLAVSGKTQSIMQRDRQQCQTVRKLRKGLDYRLCHT